MFRQNQQETYEPASGSRWSVGALLNALEWDHVRAEVEREKQARVVLAGLRGAGKSSLLNRLRGWEVSRVGLASGAALAEERQGEPNGLEDFGLFVLLDLPDGAWNSAYATADPPYDSDGARSGEVPPQLAEADLIVLLCDGENFAGETEETNRQEACGIEDAAARVRGDRGRQATEYRWFCRLRSLGRPLIVVLNKVDLLGERAAGVQAELARRMVAPIVSLSTEGEDDLVASLLPAMLEAEPDLLVPLGREIPAARRPVARRLIRQATLVSALMGLQPVPLLDVPLQLTAQTRLLLRLAAMYSPGKPGSASREMVASVAGGLGLRMALQQVAKLIPVLGWLVSAALSGLTTWLMGWGAVGYYDRSWSQHAPRLPALPQLAAPGQQSLQEEQAGEPAPRRKRRLGWPAAAPGRSRPAAGLRSRLLRRLPHWKRRSDPAQLDFGAESAASSEGMADEPVGASAEPATHEEVV